MLRIGLVGCGAIGSALAKTIVKKFYRHARLVCIADRNPSQIQTLRKKFKLTRVRAVSVPELIRQSDFIIEAASIEAVSDILPAALRRGKDVLILSVGGILKISNLNRLLRKSRSHIFIPSGAVAGIDGVLAAKTGRIYSVSITTRKPLRSLRHSPFLRKHKLLKKKIHGPTLIFEGTASQAVRHFPQNINVAATLSLAGIGPGKTRVRIYASPTYRYNTHEIEVNCSFGRIFSEVRNVPSRENPKTSALAIGSATAALEKIFAQLKIGT